MATSSDMAMSRRFDVYTLLLAVAHALLFMAAFPPMNLWPLILLSPVPLAILARSATSTRQALLIVFLVQTALWLWMSRWLWQITEAGLIPYAMAMAGWSVLMVWILRSIVRHRMFSRLPMALTLPIVWAGFEFFRGELLFDGYPWFLIAHPLVEWPLAVQAADLFGTYYLSFLVAMIAGAVVDALGIPAAIAKTRGSGPQGRAIATRISVVGLVVLLIGLHLGYGKHRLGQDDVLSPGPSLLVIQTNLPQDNKMRSTPEEHWQHFQSFLALTVDAYDSAIGAGKHVDLIVWPETMVTGWGFEPHTLSFFLERDYWPGFRFAMAVEVAAAELGVPMLVGSPAILGVHMADAHSLNWDAHYNSAYLIESAQDEASLGTVTHQRYDKVFLTPFGETMPYIRAWPWLQEKMLAVGAQGMQFNLQPGAEPRVLDFNWDGRNIGLATPICFEATMARVNRSIVYNRGEKRADVLVNLSNDGWFGSFDPGRVQHAQISRLRTIENRVPMVRSANTGLSISIDSVGRVVETIGDGRYGVSQQSGSLLAHVTLDARQTLYGRVGDIWGWACLALVLIAVPIVFLSNSEKNK